MDKIVTEENNEMHMHNSKLNANVLFFLKKKRETFHTAITAETATGN